MGFISTEIIALIRERTDIIQIIGEHVRLNPSGNSYKALCPFHKEKTASFHVIPDKQIYHCFGCGKGGDVFSFLMELEHMTFPEVVKFLAAREGIEIPEEHDPEADRKADLYNYLDRAACFFETCLYDSSAGTQAREYLKQRKISSESAKKFRVGFAPNAWDSIVHRLGRTPEDLASLEKAGLIKERSQGEGYYDVFRNRLMIPILDVHGRVAGFGGRVLSPDDEPKYLNSAESETFNKRRMLFNFREAVPVARRLNSVIVVEGYLDAISLYQNGIRNVVASLGTAISAEQIHMLARNCEVIYFCYDGDAAGQRATLRAISLQKDAPVNARVVAFPDPTDDPDSFVSREGGDSFKKLLEKASDIYTFLIETHTRGLKPPLEIPVKEKLIQDFKELVPAIHSSIARSEVIRKISKLLDMDQHVLEKEFAGREAPRSEETQKKRTIISPRLNAEIQRQEWVLKHLLEHPEELDRIRALLGPGDFSDPRLREIFEAISFQQEAAGGSLKPAEILAALDEASLISRLSELITTLEDRPPEPFMECVKGLVKTRLDTELKLLQERIREAERTGNDQIITSISMEQLDLKRKIEMLY
ncbi:MAG TPA: DNA primase [Candidatus Rifleibacterium sp.]|nr:DNA primase [Candidatus Rifleibacterium sp.]HPT44919.1 DNA primase [Candidatus Rifleibacterium sp.]